MTANGASGDVREELRAAVDGLSEARARTLLGWLRVDPRQREPGAAGDQSVGPLGDTLGIVGEVLEPGYSRMRLDVDPAWHNPNGVLHGAVIYTMVDYSMGGTVQRGLPENEYCATIEIKINYLATVREGTLTAESRVVKQGRNVAFTESKVTDGQQRLVATASGSWYIFRPRPAGAEPAQE